MVLVRPVALISAKSAMLASILATAAQPPLFSNSLMRNSLNQTSPQTLVLFLLRNPTMITRTFPKLGFPLIPIRIGFEEPIKLGSNSAWS